MYRFKDYKQPTILSHHLKLGGSNPAGEQIDVTSLYFTRNDTPWIGIMGEFHYSRYDRKQWYKELCKMKAGGITLVSTYIFWIYHEEIEGEYDFSGDNDLRAFILECQRAGLEVVIRIGPWAHGECRNGGFPDWLLQKPFKLRDNNPDYLDKVRSFYRKIADQVQGLLFKDGGNIIAVQLENELTDQAEHLRTLKEIAIACGLIAPLYTVTGWNAAAGAKIPVEEVVPVFGGYCDAPWDEHFDQLPPSPHYFFTGKRNDTGIGADLLPQETNNDDGWKLPYEKYPFATCELGGGLQVTHHRRSIVKGMDIYAIALVKLGDGNNLVGYYMYHGGTNKIGKRSTLQESKATGYPNDYPILSYDFQTALSEYGEVREQYRLLNLLHMFIQDFGHILAPMVRVEAEHRVKREDTTSLRYALRTDGKSGFVFINHYQRLTKLEDIHDAVVDTGIVAFPSINVCGEISFFMPFNMDLAGVHLTYATAQPICKHGSTYFFVQIPGIEAVYQFNGSESETIKSPAGLDSLFTVEGVNIVTLTWEQANYLRKLDGEVYIGEGCDIYKSENNVVAVQDGDFAYWTWLGDRFERKSIGQAFTKPTISFTSIEHPPFEAKYVEYMHIGGERKITWQKVTVTGSQGFVEIDYYGDMAQLYADGELVADSFYYGLVWRVPAQLLAGKACYLAVSELRDDFYREF